MIKKIITYLEKHPVQLSFTSSVISGVVSGIAVGIALKLIQ